ncbi:lamin tail domain-containing protein [Crateriforma conspicua]|nr:lamin tail domain-containing protein [Crateriforma conspicua]
MRSNFVRCGRRNRLTLEILETRRLLAAMRVATWNVLNNPDNTTEDADFRTVLQAIGNETVGSVTKSLDLLTLSETDSSSISRVESILDGLYPHTDFGYVISPSDGGGDATGFVYDTSTMLLQESILVPGAFTHTTLRAKFRPIGTSGTEDFFVYSTHLKAGTSSSDRSRRGTEASLLHNDANSLGEGANVLITGDFNMKTSSEPAWSNLTAAGPGQVLDIYGPGGAGSWNDNGNFKHLHSQDPRTSGAGMDDRFDIQFASGEFFDGVGIDYIDGSYHVFGNNGTHTLNGSILTGTGASPSVLHALESASDHLPVVSDFEVSDSVQVIVNQTGGGTSVAESGVSDTYTLKLSHPPSHSVTVSVDPNSQLDLGYGAGVARSYIFTPQNWSSEQTISVTGVDDSVVEGPHLGTISHSSFSSDPDFNGLSIENISVNIIDNDYGPGISITHSGGGLDVAEGGQSDSYSVVLDTAPSSNVSVTVTPDGQLDLGSGQATSVVLTFTPSNWQSPQSVTVVAFDDAVIEGPHLGGIYHATSSSDPSYNDLAIEQLFAQVADNDLSPSQSVVISEIMYNPDTSEVGSLPEWLEIVNTGSSPVDLSGWYFADEDASWGSFPTGTILPPNQAAVVYDNRFTSDSVFRSAWNIPSDAIVSGVQWGSLSNSPSSSNEVLRLFDAGAFEIDYVNYDDAFPWPSDSPDGPSIYLTDLLADNSMGDSWTRSSVGIDGARAASSPFSSTDVGSPGDFPALPAPASLIVSESHGSTAVNEGGIADSIQVSLTGTPNSNVLVTLTPTNAQIDLGAGTGVPLVLTFTPADSGIPQSVFVSAEIDGFVEGYHWSAISISSQSSDQAFANLTANDITVGIQDVTLRGDMNGDGHIDSLDIAPFSIAIIDPQAYAQAFPGFDPNVLGDLTGDGIIDTLDIAPFSQLIMGT